MSSRARITHPDVLKGRTSAFTANRIGPSVAQRQQAEEGLGNRGAYSREKMGQFSTPAAPTTLTYTLAAAGDAGQITYTTQARTTASAFASGPLSCYDDNTVGTEVWSDGVFLTPAIVITAGQVIRSATLRLYCTGYADSGKLQSPEIALVVGGDPVAALAAGTVLAFPTDSGQHSYGAGEIKSLNQNFEFDVTAGIQRLFNSASWAEGLKAAIAVRYKPPLAVAPKYRALTFQGYVGVGGQRPRLTIKY